MKKSNDLNNPEIATQPQQTSTIQQPVNDISPQPSIQPQSNKKWLISSLVGLVVLSLSVAGYFAYQDIQSKEQSSSIQPTPTLSSSQTLSPTNNPVSKPELSNKLISYTTNEGLVVSDIDGNNKKAVFTVIDSYFSWDWNPMANEVVASNGILKNIDTGIEKKVPSGRCHNWSPDGKMIAYQGSGGLYYAEVSNFANPIKFSETGMLCGGSNSVFHWLPDSKSLIYLTSNGAVYINEIIHSIMKYDINSRSTTKIYQDEKGSGQIRTPSISLDGTKVVFMMSVDKGNNSQLTENVYTINIDGSGLTQLTNLEVEGEYGQGIGQPIFSTDNKSIFFISNSTISKYQGLTMLDIQTKTVTRLANEVANVYSPATISPDGKYVAYDAFSKVVVVNLETKNKTLINDAGFVLWQK